MKLKVDSAMFVRSWSGFESRPQRNTRAASRRTLPSRACDSPLSPAQGQGVETSEEDAVALDLGRRVPQGAARPVHRPGASLGRPVSSPLRLLCTLLTLNWAPIPLIRLSSRTCVLHEALADRLLVRRDPVVTLAARGLVAQAAILGHWLAPRA